MNSTDVIITKSFEYYDKNTEHNNELFKNVRYVTYSNNEKDLKQNHINMYDKNKKIIKKYTYEHIGVLDNMSNSWTWAWSIPNYTKNLTYISRRILNYGFNLDLQYMFLRYELLTSRFRISNPIQVDIHISLASYLSKHPVIFKLDTLVDNTDPDENYLKINDDDTKKNNITYYLFILDEINID
jgi:hypothetical protein